MPRFPATKVYRAFPELDRFSDRQCRVFVDIAQRREWVSCIAAGLLAVAATFSAWYIAGSMWAFIADLPSGWGRVSHQTDTGPLLTAMLTIASLAFGPICGLLVRDHWLRWAIRRNIDLARCPACRYSLLGLRVSRDDAGHHTTCPECGAPIRLEDAGIPHADLLVMHPADAPRSAPSDRALRTS